MSAQLCRCCLRNLLASALLLLLPALSRPVAVLRAAEASPGLGPLASGPRTLPPLSPGPTAAQSPGRAPAESPVLRGPEGGNGSSPGAGLSADDLSGKAGKPPWGQPGCEPQPWRQAHDTAGPDRVDGGERRGAGILRGQDSQDEKEKPKDKAVWRFGH